MNQHIDISFAIESTAIEVRQTIKITANVELDDFITNIENGTYLTTLNHSSSEPGKVLALPDLDVVGLVVAQEVDHDLSYVISNVGVA